MPKVKEGYTAKVNASFTLDKKVMNWLKRKSEVENVPVSRFLNNFIIKFAKTYAKQKKKG